MDVRAEVARLLAERPEHNRTDEHEALLSDIMGVVEAVIEEVEKFDPSDNYHEPEWPLDARSYYAGIDRVVALLKGRIADWTSPRQSPR